MGGHGQRQTNTPGVNLCRTSGTNCPTVDPLLNIADQGSSLDIG